MTANRLITGRRCEASTSLGISGGGFPWRDGGATPQPVRSAADIAGIDAEPAAFQQGAHGVFAEEMQAGTAWVQTEEGGETFTQTNRASVAVGIGKAVTQEE